MAWLLSSQSRRLGPRSQDAGPLSFTVEHVQHASIRYRRTRREPLTLDERAFDERYRDWARRSEELFTKASRYIPGGAGSSARTVKFAVSYTHLTLPTICSV